MRPFARKPKEQSLVVVEEAPRFPPCNNAEVIRQWWQSKSSEKTQLAYQKDAQRFLACIGEKPLNYAGLDDLYAYQRALAGQGQRAYHRLPSVLSVPLGLERKEAHSMSQGPMPSYLEPITQRLHTLRSWRDLQRLLAAYPHQERSWRGHLRVRGTLSGQQKFFEGMALEVSTYEAAPNDHLPLTLLVRLDNGQEREVEVKQMQAIGVVW